jgi:hypothetical protein
MRKLWILTALSVGTLCAQSPNLSGVWKADIAKSKFGGPQPPTNYLVIFDQESPKLTETTGSWGEHGEQRSKVTFTIDGKPTVTAFRGIPTRATASWAGNVLSLTAEPAASKAVTKEKYELSSDGSTLTITSTTTMEGRPPRETLVVLMKQPDAAGEPLRKPEEVASARFKNVTSPLKDLPASEFIDAMRYFTFSLGEECEFCHVRGKFDADDKKEKKMARKMLAMTQSINTENFDGKREVRCYTCHQGHNEPMRRPLFAGETPEKKGM